MKLRDYLTEKERKLFDYKYMRSFVIKDIDMLLRYLIRLIDEMEEKILKVIGSYD